MTASPRRLRAGTYGATVARVRVRGTRDKVPLLLVDWKLASGPIATDPITLFEKRPWASASPSERYREVANKLKLRALCGAIGVDLALFPRRIRRDEDFGPFIDALRRAGPANIALVEGRDEHLQIRYLSRTASAEPPPSAPREAEPAKRTAGPLVGLSIGEKAIVGYDELVAATSQPLVYRWEGIVADGNVVELTGPSGGGKTTLAVLLVVALANAGKGGVQVLTHDVKPIDPRKYVVIIEAENGRHSVRRKLEESCAMLGLPVKETVDRCVMFVRSGLHMNAPDGWTELHELVARGHVGALFIDTRAQVLDAGDPNDEADQAAVARDLSRLADVGQIPIFIISHTRKAGTSAIEDIGGSAQRGASLDVVILVTADRASSGKVLQSTATFLKLRDDLGDWPQPQTFKVSKDPAGQATVEWGCRPIANKGAKRSEVDGEVLAALGVLGPGDHTVSRIRIQVSAARGSSPGSKASVASVGAALADLERRRLVVRGEAVGTAATYRLASESLPAQPSDGAPKQ